MSLRVISGSAKGRRLKSVPGDSTRPIMDRVKEALFSIIGRDIYDAIFLDLFGGTGSVGIEALSRGAEQVVFVEKDKFALQTIRDNLKATNLEENAIIRRGDAFQFLKTPPHQTYDFIYIAPPQYKGMWVRTLKALEETEGWVRPETMVIVQIDPKEEEDGYESELLIETDRRKYGKTLLLFYEHRDVVEEE